MQEKEIVMIVGQEYGIISKTHGIAIEEVKEYGITMKKSMALSW